MTNKELKDFVEETRNELGETLDEIDERLKPKNLAKQAMNWVSVSYDRSPGKWLTGIAVGVVGTVALVLWAVLGDDD